MQSVETWRHTPANIRHRQANETKDRISHFGRRCKITNKTSSSQLFPSPCPERNGAKGKKRRAAGKTAGKNSVDILRRQRIICDILTRNIWHYR